MAKAYRSAKSYRRSAAYRGGYKPSKEYRTGTPYRKPDLYGGQSSQPAVPRTGNADGARLAWERPVPGCGTHSMRFDSIDSHERQPDLPWRGTRPFNGVVALPLHQPGPQDPATRFPHGDMAMASGAAVCAPYRQTVARDGGTGLPWSETDERDAISSSLRFTQPPPDARVTSARWSALAQHALQKSLLWRRIVERGGLVALPWSPIAARSSSTVIVWPPTPPTDDDTILIPELPVYVMLPTLSAVRLPDRTPIPLLSISLQEEIGGFVWSFTAPMSRAGLELVNPDGGALPEIEVTINGFVWTFLVDAYDDNRRFGSNTLTLRGRSPAAALAAPHAPTRTFTQPAARDASQLATEELPAGWTLVWDAVDWLVPGGTFSYQDLAPIEAIAQVASAIGAAVLSDPAEKSLHVVPSYEHSPWAWDAAAPYAILPAAVIAEGSSSWKGGFNPDGIYVYAQNAPSGAFVKITGSAGAVQVPMVVDPLLVHPDAQRERGRHELASYGKARTVQRTVPLFPTPAPEGMPDLGVVRPGKLLEVEDTDETWRGMVTAVRIDAQRSGKALSVRQHLTIERQFR